MNEKEAKGEITLTDKDSQVNTGLKSTKQNGNEMNQTKGKSETSRSEKDRHVDTGINSSELNENEIKVTEERSKDESNLTKGQTKPKKEWPSIDKNGLQEMQEKDITLKGIKERLTPISEIGELSQRTAYLLPLM